MLSAAINGNVALTIRATKIASDSRYAKNRRGTPHLGGEPSADPAARRPVGLLVHARRYCDCTGELVLQRTVGALFRGTGDRNTLPALDLDSSCNHQGYHVGAKLGIIIKDPSILEKMESCHVLIVDKTGTLTYGKPSLTVFHCFGGISRARALQYVASLERYSKHPGASAVLATAAAEVVTLLDAEGVAEAPGAGSSGTSRAVLSLSRDAASFRLRTRRRCRLLQPGWSASSSSMASWPVSSTLRTSHAMRAGRFLVTLALSIRSRE